MTTIGTTTTNGSLSQASSMSSGLDTEALVNAAVDGKKKTAYLMDDKIKTNAGKITAYQTLLTDSTALQNDIKALSSAEDNVLDANSAYLSADDGSDPTDYMDVSTDSTAVSGTYNITITQMAKAMKVNSSSISSKTADLGYSGAISLGLGSGSSANISITADMSLSEMTTAINAVSATTGVKATIISSAGGYTMVLSGTSNAKTINASGPVLQDLGILDAGGDFVKVSQEAKQAIISLDGTEITSDTNIFTDVVEGVDITLYSEKEGATITLEIDHDYASVKDALQNFIDDYNALRDFVMTQSKVSDNSASGDAVLFADGLLRTMQQQLYDLINTTNSHNGSIVNLANMGISFNSNNELEISDESALNDALLNHFGEVKALLQTQVSASSDSLKTLRSNAAADLSFTIDITTNSSGVITGAGIGGDSSMFTISGTRITGKTGTIYEGLVLVYTGTTSASISYDSKAGIADKMNHLLGSYTDASKGIITNAVNNLTDTNESLQTQSDRIKERADGYGEKLTNKYAAMEAKVKAAKLLKQQIEAIIAAWSNTK